MYVQTIIRMHLVPSLNMINLDSSLVLFTPRNKQQTTSVKSSTNQNYRKMIAWLDYKLYRGDVFKITREYRQFETNAKSTK